MIWQRTAWVENLGRKATSGDLAPPVRAIEADADSWVRALVGRGDTSVSSHASKRTASAERLDDRQTCCGWEDRHVQYSGTAQLSAGDRLSPARRTPARSFPTKASAMRARAVEGWPSWQILETRQMRPPRSDAPLPLPNLDHITARAHPPACAAAPSLRTSSLFCQPNPGPTWVRMLSIIWAL